MVSQDSLYFIGYKDLLRMHRKELQVVAGCILHKKPTSNREHQLIAELLFIVKVCMHEFINHR